VLIFVIPALGIILYSGFEHRQDAIKDEKEDALAALQGIASQHELTVEGARQLLMTLSMLPEVQKQKVAACNKLLSELLKLNPVYANLFIATPEGQVISSALPFTPHSTRHRKYFQDALKAKGLSVGEFVIGVSVKESVLHFAFPMLDPEGKLRGIVVAAVNLDLYGKTFLKAKLPKDSVISILDHRGIRLFRYPDSEGYIGKADNPDRTSKMRDGPEEGVFLSGRGGEKRLIAYKRFHLHDGALPYLYIYIDISEKQVLTKTKRLLLINLALLGIAFFVAALSAMLIGNSMIVRKLGKLIEATRELGVGDLKTRTGLVHGKDELGQLAQTFDEMAEKLEQKESEQKKAKDKLLQSEERYRRIFENAVEGIYQTTPEGRYISVNPSFARMFGFASPEDMMRDVTDIGLQLYVNPGDRERLKRLLVQHGVAEGFEVQLYRKDKSTFWVSINAHTIHDPDGNILYYEGTNEDISQRKKSEMALEESEAKYRSVVENSLVGFYIIQNGLFRFVNRRFCEMHGYAYEEVIDRMGPIHLVYPDDREIVKEHLRGRQTGETDHTEYSFRAIRKDGGVITMKVIGSTMSFNGRPAVTGSILDITREETLANQLRQSQKMEAIGLLAGGIAHDFNNILTTIIGFGSLLQLDSREGSHLKMYVEAILEAAEKAASLVQGLLAFSRKQKIILKPLRINDTITGAEKILKRLLTEDIELKVKLSSDDMVIMADDAQINQILFNLVGNARDAMPGGGTLIIEAKPFLLDSGFVKTHGYGEPGEYALLTISDTGHGMDKKTRVHIFEPFFTTKELGKGTGLGLSTVYGIVKQHKGFINVYSEPGIGTTFNIYFSLIQGVFHVKNHQPAPIKRGAETILICEDNRELRKFMKEILERYGYTVIESGDGEEAIGCFMEMKDRIDLLILDVVMPKKNGKEAYDAVINMRPDIKVIFTSGYTSDIVLDKGIHESEFNFISKPMSPDILLQKVREVLDI
jgi:PAS domain S-box-containing protein